MKMETNICTQESFIRLCSRDQDRPKDPPGILHQTTSGGQGRPLGSSTKLEVETQVLVPVLSLYACVTISISLNHSKLQFLHVRLISKVSSTFRLMFALSCKQLKTCFLWLSWTLCFLPNLVRRASNTLIENLLTEDHLSIFFVPYSSILCSHKLRISFFSGTWCVENSSSMGWVAAVTISDP